MISLLFLFTLVLCGSGLLQNDLSALEEVLRSSDMMSMKRESYNLRGAMTKKYLGCYQDRESRAIPMNYAFESSRMSVQKCYDNCKSKGKRYFALQASTWCICGASSADYDKYGVGYGCNMACAGSSSEKCGGSWHNSVYEIRAADGYLGCYMDRENRAIPMSSAFESKQMTVRTCYNTCRSRGKRYYALQASTWCLCGDATDVYDKYGAGTGCNLPCAGGGNERCGGHWYNSVYVI